MSLYRQVFKKSFQLSWRNKKLWLFGLLSILVSGSVLVELLFRLQTQNSYVMDLAVFNALGILDGDFFNNLKILLVSDMGSVSTLFSMFFGIMFFYVLFLLISSLFYTILIKESAELIKSKQIKETNLKDKLARLFKKSWDVVTPIFAMLVFFKVLVYLIFLVLNLPIYFAQGEPSVFADAMYIFSFILVIPAIIIFSFIIKYIINYIAIFEQKFIPALKKGWQLFIKNWLVSVEMAFMLFLIYFAVALVMAIFSGVFLKFMSFIAEYLAYSMEPTYFATVSLYAYIILMIIFILVWSFIAVFGVAAWTDLFLKLDKGGFVSKIKRLLAKNKSN